MSIKACEGKMKNKFRTARQLKKLKAIEAAKLLGVSQPTLSAWETGNKTPSIDGLEKMADLYDVTTDFLLGRAESEHCFENMVSLNKKLLPIMHEKPVWSAKHGWLLVDCANSRLVGNNFSISFEQADELYIAPPQFAESYVPNSEPLSRNELQYGLQIWVEPISVDSSLREELRGWYRVKHLAIENECGNRFSLDSYGAKWLAFSDFKNILI